jgi:hypothetical protein
LLVGKLVSPMRCLVVPLDKRAITLRGGRCSAVARAPSSHGVVAMGAGGAPVMCLLEEGRPEPPSLLEAM